MIYIVIAVLIIMILLANLSIFQFQFRIIFINNNNYSFFIIRFFWGLIHFKFDISLSPIAEGVLSLFLPKPKPQMDSSTILKDMIAYSMKGQHSFSPYIHYIKYSITRIKIKRLDIILKLGLADAAGTAIVSGCIITGFSTLKGYLSKRFGLKDTNISLNPDFNEKKLDVDLDCIIDIKLGHIIIMGTRLIIDKLKGGEINGRTSY